MLLPLLSVFSSTAHTADAGGRNADEESPNCSLHGIPTNGAPCPACIQQAAKLVAPPIPSVPAATPPTMVLRSGPIEELRVRTNLGRPTGGHTALGASYA